MNHSLVGSLIGSLAATVLAGAALGAVGLAAEPQGAAPESKDRPHVKFRIISEHAALTPGQTETLGLVFTMEPHWHVYYKGAPGGGNPPTIDEANLPKGYALGEIQWPAPKRYIAPGDIYDSVYEGEIALLVPLTVPATAKAGDVAKIGLKLNWLECSDVCVFGKGEDSASLTVGSTDTKAARSADASLIDKSRSLMPKPWPTDGAKADLANGVLAIQVPGAVRLEFYPGPGSSEVKDAAGSTAADTDKLTIRYEGANKDQVTADGVLGVWRSATAEPVYYVVKKGSSN